MVSGLEREREGERERERERGREREREREGERERGREREKKREILLQKWLPWQQTEELVAVLWGVVVECEAHLEGWVVHIVGDVEGLLVRGDQWQLRLRRRQRGGGAH